MPPAWRCHFDDDWAVAIYTFSDGCYCEPEARIQALCWYHEQKSSPNGDMVMIFNWRMPDPRKALVAGQVCLY